MIARIPSRPPGLASLLHQRLKHSTIFDFIVVIGVSLVLPVRLFSIFYLHDILIILFILIFVPYFIKEFKKFYFVKEHLLVFFFAAWSLIVHLVNPWREGGFLLCWSMYLVPGILFISFTQIIYSGPKSKALENGWIIWGLLIAVQLLLELYSSPLKHLDLHYKANVYWGRSNYVAAMLEMPVLWCFHHMHQKNSGRIAAAIGFFICLLALFLTVSRGGIITIVVAILFYSMLKKNVFSFFLFIVFAAMIFPHLSARFKGILDSGNVDRIYLWLQSIEMIKKNPIIGYGPGDVQLYAALFSSTDLMSDPHNFIMTVLLHTGGIGFILFASIMIIFIRRAFLVYKKQKNPVFIVIILSAFLHGTVEPTFIGESYSFFFWFCMVMLMIQSEQLKTLSTKRVMTLVASPPSLEK